MSSNIAGKSAQVLLSVLVTTAGWSVPTSKSGDCAQGLCPSRTDHQKSAHSVYSPSTAEILETSISLPANIAAELLKPPVDSMDSPALSTAARPLPAVPGALFMVLTGFLCVSAVRDRKVWLAVLAGLLCVGHIGKVILGARCSHMVGIPDTAEKPRVKRGAKYLAPPFRRDLPLKASRRATYGQRTTNYEKRTTNKVAINPAFSYLIEATKRLAFITEWHAYFSPAFIFQNLARGPPESAW